MDEFIKTKLTYRELLSTLSEINLIFYAQAFANCRFLAYITKERHLPNVEHNFVLSETTTTRTLRLKGEVLVSSLEKIASYYGRDFDWYVRNKFFSILIKQSRDKYITNVFDLIYNYAHHTSKTIIPHLQTLDWYQVLHLLRRNISHFDNIGKPLGGWPQAFPPVVKWNSLEIRPEQMGHEIQFSNDYAIALIKQCKKYIEDNEPIFSKS